MDAVTICGLSAFAGAALNGIRGYAQRPKNDAGVKEPFSAVKFGQSLIVGVVSGAGAASAAMAGITPDAGTLTAISLGLGAGYGIDSARSDLGLKY